MTQTHPQTKLRVTSHVGVDPDFFAPVIANSNDNTVLEFGIGSLRASQLERLFNALENHRGRLGEVKLFAIPLSMIDITAEHLQRGQVTCCSKWVLRTVYLTRGPWEQSFLTLITSALANPSITDLEIIFLASGQQRDFGPEVVELLWNSRNTTVERLQLHGRIQIDDESQQHIERYLLVNRHRQRAVSIQKDANGAVSTDAFARAILDNDVIRHSLDLLFLYSTANGDAFSELCRRAADFERSRLVRDVEVNSDTELNASASGSSGPLAGETEPDTNHGRKRSHLESSNGEAAS